MKTSLISYIVTLVIFTGIDFIWLGRMGDIVYRPVMGNMALEGFRAAPAVVFYLIFAAGVVYFAVSPALASGQWQTALLKGALFGFFAYATYDLTNQATLKNWSTFLSFVDLGWGTVLTGVSATLSFLLVSFILRLV